jgi:hypothetical protein
MPPIVPGRYTAELDGPFVLFLIGARINNLLAINKWLPVTQAMPRMLAELARKPELGLLHSQIMLSWRGVNTIQYWRSFEHLHAYAHARESAHLPAWAAFNRAAKDNTSVGIWHETYLINQGSYEAIYADMPRCGLAAAGAHLPATGRRDTARERLAASQPPRP